MARAPTSGITLGHRETCVVKGMLARGDRQHDIASYFGVNPARINEVVSRTNNWPNEQPTAEADLPPPGPYMTKFAVQSVIDTLNEALEALELAEQENELAAFSRGADQVAVIAAHHSRRPVEVVDAPIAVAHVRLRKQAALNLRCEFEVALQRSLLFARQVIEAQTSQRIKNQPFLFDRIVANVAKSVGSFIHSADR